VSDPNSDLPGVSKDECFVTTHWSMVVRAGRVSSPGADAALTELCRTYWYPLYAFARRQGRSPTDAEDLTQSFFARLLEKNYLADAQREKGRFRTFLLTAFKRFLANEWDRQHALKRGGFDSIVSMDQDWAESRLQAEPSHHTTPETLFERQWAVTLLDQVLKQLETEYTVSGRAEVFRSLRPSLVRGESPKPYSAIATELGLTEPAVKMAVQRLRNRYRELLCAEIAKTVCSPDEVEDEIRQLFSVFGT
jgi:RNA polymerase sigma-70 factor (ECF subfamily)